MSNFIINGGNKLKGEITIQTSKNATLPIMSACLLTDEDVIIKNIPNLRDIDNMMAILSKLGVNVKKNNKDLVINAKYLTNDAIDKELSKTMRSSLFLLGSTLSRHKKTILAYPGGCKIGKRPIDIHIQAFLDLGVDIIEHQDTLTFDATKAHSAKIRLKLPSVGATENIILFASTLQGKTEIFNSAKEPEIVDLCNILISMGANIKGAGTNHITIIGVTKLHGTTYQPAGDRIVAGTMMIATAMCGGNVIIKNAKLSENKKLFQILSKIGCQIKNENDIIHISSDGAIRNLGQISTGYYPKFPTDLQSMILSLATICPGTSVVKETVFENRFLITDMLCKMGADITLIANDTLKIVGKRQLHGSSVKTRDLRGGAALILAGLVATGQTQVIDDNCYIDRGYDCIEDMFTSLGADIKRI